MDSVITLYDESGNEVPFDFLDLIEYEGSKYVVVLPPGGRENEEAGILRLEEGDEDADEDLYVAVKSEEGEAVFGIFKEKFKEEFNAMYTNRKGELL